EAQRLTLGKAIAFFIFRRRLVPDIENARVGVIFFGALVLENSFQQNGDVFGIGVREFVNMIMCIGRRKLVDQFQKLIQAGLIARGNNQTLRRARDGNRRSCAGFGIDFGIDRSARGRGAFAIARIAMIELRRGGIGSRSVFGIRFG